MSTSKVSIDGSPPAAARRLHAPPVPVRAERPGAPVVTAHHCEHLSDACLGGRVLDGGHGLDAPVEVALHEIGRADVVALPVALAETEHARVLQVAAHDGADPDRLAVAGHARLQGAHAPDDEVDGYAGLAGPIGEEGHVRVHARG